jgi:hypothetical protein
MAPVEMSRPYRSKGRRTRPCAGIHNVLKEIRNNYDEKSVTAFDALFTRNIKVLKCQKSGKDYSDRQNKNRVQQLQYNIIQTDFDTVNADSFKIRFLIQHLTEC